MAEAPAELDRAIDVLGLGVAAVDDLLYVDVYPTADEKAPVRRRARQCGGLTATALVAAARLGSLCMYAGVLGDDDLSSFVITRLAAEGIDLSHLVRQAGARPIHSTVIVEIGRATRTLFFDTDGVAGAPDAAFVDEVVRASRVLFVDPFGLPGMVRAATTAREAGIPVVADFEGDVVPPGLPALQALVNHLILSRDFAELLTGEDGPARAAEALWSDGCEVAIVTCGAGGCWYVTRPSQRHAAHVPAYRVDVVDTTGCGDVFHGAYASALARGMGVDERIRFAAAAAALKAMRPGGQAGIPGRADVEAFLALREIC
jgi:sugar/nucleoside kinase (ribokinase family)